MDESGVAFTTKWHKARVSNKCFILHIGDDILYINSKQVKNSFLLIIELLGLINLINAFVTTYLSCVVDVVDKIR